MSDLVSTRKKSSLPPSISTLPLAAVALAAIVLSASGTWAQVAEELVPLPKLSLENAESGVRERLDEARLAVEWILSQGTGDSAELAQAYGELGRLYLANGLNVAAAIALTNAIISTPEDFRWSYYFGVLQHQERRLEESEGALRHALKLRQGDVPTLLHLGDVLLLADRPEEAAKFFDQALVQSSKSQNSNSPSSTTGALAFARFSLGRIAMGAEDWAKAALHFEAALEAAPEASAVRRLLGLAYRELGDRERARQELAKSGQVPVVFADPLVDSLTDLDTGSYLWRALGARRGGDLELAARLYRQAIEAEGEAATHRRSLSNVLALQGDVAGAIAEMERAIEIEPQHVDSYLQLGQLISRRGGGRDGADRAANLQQGLKYIEKAVQLAPNARAPRIVLARNLAMAQRHQEALTHYDAALALDPRDPRVRLLRARSRARLGRDDLAVEDLEAVLVAEPKNPRALLELATVLSRQGGNERALELFETSLELDLGDRDRTLALFSSAALRQQKGDDAGAISLYRQVLDLAPGMKDAHFNLATALARGGRAVEAAAHFRRAAEIDPADVSARLAWVQAMQTNGDFAAARAALEEVVKGREAEADVRLVHRLAQLLSTCPDLAQRDATRGVDLAVEAMRRDATVQHAVTLARALAGAGRTSEAVTLQRKIVQDAQGLGLSADQLKQLRQVLAYYESLVNP